jgi:hypothetical protein
MSKLTLPFSTDPPLSIGTHKTLGVKHPGTTLALRLLSSDGTEGGSVKRVRVIMGSLGPLPVTRIRQGSSSDSSINSRLDSPSASFLPATQISNRYLLANDV